jgi:tripartite-type tricarboxylate transporter receptor subunit TctC
MFKFYHAMMGALASFALAASAQTFPVKPVALVVPFAAGGNNDVSGRIIAQKMGESLGQQMVVENKAGASGAIGLPAM